MNFNGGSNSEIKKQVGYGYFTNPTLIKSYLSSLKFWMNYCK